MKEFNSIYEIVNCPMELLYRNRQWPTWKLMKALIEVLFFSRVKERVVDVSALTF